MCLGWTQGVHECAWWLSGAPLAGARRATSAEMRVAQASEPRVWPHTPLHITPATQATLEEVTEADLLLHVLDASSPHVLEQRRVVLEVWQEGGPFALLVA